MAAGLRHNIFHSILYQQTVCLGCFRYASTEPASTALDAKYPRPFNEIPHKKGYPFIGNFLEAVQSINKLHILMRDRHEMLGPIFREKTGSFDMVCITDVDALEQLLRQDGKYPNRTDIPAFIQHRIDSGEASGILIAKDEDWARMRRVLNRRMLNIKHVEKYVPDFNEVSRDFLDRLEHVRTEDNRITGLNTELFHWALESVSTLLYGRRMGCLSENPDPELKSFIEAAHHMFHATANVLFFPPWFAKVFLPKRWNDFKSTMDTLFRVARKCVDEKLEMLKEEENEELGFLEYILSEHTLTPQEIYANVTELMIGSVDTTSNVVQMILYELSRNTRVQQKLYDEVTGVVPEGEFPSAAQLQNMPYLKAVIKETLRLYPIGNNINRVLQKDMTILGYHIPAEKTVTASLYVLGRLPSLYDDPESFRPERWLRGNLKEQDKMNRFAFLPFGHGVRMCIGRRLSELEMQVLIAQMVARYCIQPVTMDPVVLKTALLLQPSEPINVRLVDRES
ncbi:1,25-dihydroxyvitamin D(3) 24-hydroxylase, mitochondrial-like [Gigantopelta aegis]|uniref:1,25-dihydroxyvitamin D(3) 24-hydroxylase, mitochondrial-like n=1 Tax=Gigantopelta aegis TaxID=1735272 RepID=UPI001B88840B|nr:1,25-dihydroxyvitamin D(3) 24-hydroxylase, mitochondrial-like [Gigantopelta aegis]